MSLFMRGISEDMDEQAREKIRARQRHCRIPGRHREELKPFEHLALLAEPEVPQWIDRKKPIATLVQWCQDCGAAHVKEQQDGE